jgi:glycosyltransferase involved in cell wall biosynthesis
MRDVIFISLENWDGVWRRNQFLCAEWLRRYPGMRLLFVGRSRDFSHAVRTWRWDGLRQTAVRTLPDFPGLTLFNPLKLFPNSISACRSFNANHLEFQLRSAARLAGLRSPLLWINDHHAAPLAGRLNERAVVYDITDDWTLMPAIGAAERSRICTADGTLCARADLVVVCSSALEKSRRTQCRSIVRVPNGVDAAHYASCRSARRPPGDSPVFGYVGSLHGDRLDLDLIEALATGWRNGRIVLCGPNFLTLSERDRLHGLPNVEVCPPVDYQEVPSVMAGFDVCILPHRCSPFTESLNPIKLWEYLASGKPVAATPVAGFREFGHLCHLGAGSSGFLAAVAAALREEPSRSLARVREAESNSWRMRSDQIVEVFRQQGWLGRPLPRPRRGARANAAGKPPEGVGAQVSDAREGGREWEELCGTTK